MTLGEAYIQLLVALKKIYEPREAATIANLVTEHVTGYANSSRILHKNNSITEEQNEKLQKITLDLLAQKPVQYVLGEAYFYGMKLHVNEDVLIPRPETEELVEWIINDVKLQAEKEKNQDATFDRKFKMLDIGTGSGCIAVAIKKNLPDVTVYATDVSKKALLTANKNAAEQATEIHFSEVNILDEQQWKAFPRLDYIISNPPYITQSEAVSINGNVINFEPYLALFVPNETPLLFYDIIASFGLLHLKKEGKLFFEINEAFGEEAAALLLKKNYKNIEIRKDMQGKDRMIKAEK